MRETVSVLIREIRAGYAALADAEIAAGQQAYMKSTIPYYGVKTPESRKLLAPLLKQYQLQTVEEWELAIRTLWHEVTHREEWYAAIGIATHKPYRAWRSSLDAIPLYDELIRAGAWWDVCDTIAQDMVGDVLMAHRTETAAIMRAWSTDEHRWIRRCSILSQNKHKHQTDPDLLRECILPSIDDTDFFSRKGIGWALRQYAYINPDWVVAFVEEFEDRLSGLSKREALKHIPVS